MIRWCIKNFQPATTASCSSQLGVELRCMKGKPNWMQLLRTHFANRNLRNSGHNSATGWGEEKQIARWGASLPILCRMLVCSESRPNWCRFAEWHTQCWCWRNLSCLWARRRCFRSSRKGCNCKVGRIHNMLVECCWFLCNIREWSKNEELVSGDRTPHEHCH